MLKSIGIMIDKSGVRKQKKKNKHKNRRNKLCQKLLVLT